MGNGYKKDKTAVALGFLKGDDTPRVIASGHGYVAQKIIEGAKEENIPIHHDAGLANTLSKIDIGEFIPPELYEVVVEVLRYVDRIDAVKAKLDQT